MTERPSHSPVRAPASRGDTPSSSPSGRGESEVWSAISTLVAGPLVWGLVGLGVDTLVDGPGRLWTALGVAVGFVTSIYIVYVRSMQADGAAPTGRAAADPPPSSTGDLR